MDSYKLFFYIGIFIFISHLLIQGFSLDLSFFGLFLIIVGWRKISLWSWVYMLTWIFIVIEVLATIFKLQDMVSKYLDPSGELQKDNHIHYDENYENATQEDDETNEEQEQEDDEEQEINEDDEEDGEQDNKK